MGFYEIGNGLFEIIEGDLTGGYAVESHFEVPLHVGKRKFFVEYPPEEELSVEASLSRGHQMFIDKKGSMFWVNRGKAKDVGVTPFGDEEIRELLTVIDICTNHHWVVR